LASAALLSACAGSGDPESVSTNDSELNGFIVPGASINSPNVDPKQSYLTRRSISDLWYVGALPPDMASIAQRVDGIIANKPADGFLSIDELLTIEQPPYSKGLFPAEKLAAAKLWTLMQTNAVPVASPVVPAAASLASQIKEHRV